MKNKSTWAAVLIVVLGLSFYAYSNPGLATAQQQARAVGVSYAQLTINGEQYIWDVGGLEDPRERTLSSLLRVLGSRNKSTFVNLLNAIGSQGWVMIESNESDDGVQQWTFRRS